jgi:hypothetical protein
MDMKSKSGFTRLELLACLGACALLIAVILPALANSTSRSDRVVCLNNLRQIGVAYAQYWSEHDDRMPWRLTWSQGGNSNHPLKNSSAVQFSILSNALQRPQFLSDPADVRRAKSVASRWDTAPIGGLLHQNQWHKAISYFLGIDGSPSMPKSALAGDRNIAATPNVTSCSSGISIVSGLQTPFIRWTNEVHGLSGNVVLYDGSVQQVDTAGLRKLVAEQQQDIAGAGRIAVHVLAPF